MSLVEKARFKLRNGWRNDTAALNQYFQACVQNWKIYKGKRDPKQVMKLQCIYRQAMYGDNKAPPPENMKNISGLRWSMWTSLRGMGEEMATAGGGIGPGMVRHLMMGLLHLEQFRLKQGSSEN